MLREAGEFIGHCHILISEPKNRDGRYLITISSPSWGRGYGSEASRICPSSSRDPPDAVAPRLGGEANAVTERVPGVAYDSQKEGMISLGEGDVSQFSSK